MSAKADLSIKFVKVCRLNILKTEQILFYWFSDELPIDALIITLKKMSIVMLYFTELDWDTPGTVGPVEKKKVKPNLPQKTNWIQHLPEIFQESLSQR